MGTLVGRRDAVSQVEGDAHQGPPQKKPGSVVLYSTILYPSGLSETRLYRFYRGVPWRRLWQTST